MTDTHAMVDTHLMIDGARGKIAVLERRADHLRRKLEKDGYSSTTSADFDRAEIAAIIDACKALRYHAALEDEDLNPLVALRDLVEEIEAVKTPAWAAGLASSSEGLADAVEHAKWLLRDVSVPS